MSSKQSRHISGHENEAGPPVAIVGYGVRVTSYHSANSKKAGYAPLYPYRNGFPPKHDWGYALRALPREGEVRLYGQIKGNLPGVDRLSRQPNVVYFPNPQFG
jgi:hypothetical protein